MTNIKSEVKDHVLILKINLREEQGRSKSGKSVIIATSSGAFSVSDEEKMIFVNLNVYRK